VAQAFQPVPARAFACNYILPEPHGLSRFLLEADR
jgi:hypothetical protein